MLANDGYRIYETDQTLHVSCQPCIENTATDHSWTLKTDGQQAASAEFDDQPYADLLENAVRL